MAERRRNTARAAQYEHPAYRTWLERVAVNVVRLRTARGWSQEDAADACELGRRHFQSVEAGTLNLTVTTLSRLSSGFEVDPSELLRPAGPLRRKRPGRPSER